ncbi:MAG: glycoside hydrolase family 88 protein, partial [Bacteroidales bacterium]
MKISLSFFLLLFASLSCSQPEKKLPDEMPLRTIERIAERIIRETSFSYQLETVNPQKNLEFLEVIDFGKNFGINQPGIAFALTGISCASDTLFPIELSHTDGLIIYLNDKEVYSRATQSEFLLKHGERNIILADTLLLPLKKGKNTLLLKSFSNGSEWIVFLQPSGALIEGKSPENPLIGLEGLSDIGSELRHLTNWLVVGPFRKIPAFAKDALKNFYGPERQFQAGSVFKDGDRTLSWSVLQPVIIGNVKNTNPLWGSYSNYNYHTAGVAWTMMQLSEASGNPRWDTFALRYTDFMLASVPFINYEVNSLYQFRSANHHLIATPLLDFTLAPSLPFVQRLLKNQKLTNKQDYIQWVERMIQYALHEQSRDKDCHFNRLTPEKFTTWTDDMFMGLPFLMLAGEYVNDTILREALWNDAANQVFAFNKYVWDSAANLYQHAQYSSRKVKMPHWSRANGWAIWAVSEILLHLPKNHPSFAPLLAHFRLHAQSLAAMQNDDGFWYNVLDVPASGNETSGTAIFVMTIARGINHQWLDKDQFSHVVKKGWNAL